MGVFSLAGRDVVIRSRSRATGSGWEIAIPADAWEDGRPIPVEPYDRQFGTEIIVVIAEAWSVTLDQAARSAALHCPIAVQLNGEPLVQRD